MNLEALFRAPDVYIRDFNLQTRELLAVQMSRDTYVRSSFLDHRTVSVDGQTHRLSLDDVEQAFREAAPAPRRLNFIFHTAFSGSTLLCRCLDHPGRCLAYKEPYLLHKLCSYARGDLPFRKPNGEVPLLDLSLALLSRTYQPDEVPVIKPSDSCINLAREMLIRHKQSAAVLLYQPLEAYLLSVLKRPHRIDYVRQTLPRAQADLTAHERLAPINPDNLTDVQAASYIWAGLVYPFLDLLRDDTLQVRSLEMAQWVGHPAATLKAVARHFGLALTDEDIHSTVTEGAFTRRAHRPNQHFDHAAYGVIKADLQRMLGAEIQEGVAWLADVTIDHPIPHKLPNPLTAHSQQPTASDPRL